MAGHSRRTLWIAASGVLGTLCALASLPAGPLPPPAGRPAPDEPPRADVFVRGEGGVSAYRIPSVVVTGKGTVLAICEARKKSLADKSPTKLVARGSGDGGRTWGPVSVLHEDGEAALMDPTALVDRQTGRVWVFHVRFPPGWGRKGAKGPGVGIFTVWSDDEGKSWSKPLDLTETLRGPGWTYCALGPGVGIQTLRGRRAGRLIVPVHHKGGQCGAWHMIYSDDHGKSWQRSDGTAALESEGQLAELANGDYLLNLRSGDGVRRVCRSVDAGVTWTPPAKDAALIEPGGCQGSLLRYSAKDQGANRDRLLFANPAHPKARVNLTLRLSYDEGKSWPVSRVVTAGPAAYSCLTVLPDGGIGLLYETGAKGPYEKIVFARIPLSWLTGGKESLP